MPPLCVHAGHSAATPPHFLGASATAWLASGHSMGGGDDDALRLLPSVRQLPQTRAAGTNAAARLRASTDHTRRLLEQHGANWAVAEACNALIDNQTAHAATLSPTTAGTRVPAASGTAAPVARPSIGAPPDVAGRTLDPTTAQLWDSVYELRNVIRGLVLRGVVGAGGDGNVGDQRGDGSVGDQRGNEKSGGGIETDGAAPSADAEGIDAGALRQECVAMVGLVHQHCPARASDVIAFLTSVAPRAVATVPRPFPAPPSSGAGDQRGGPAARAATIVLGWHVAPDGHSRRNVVFDATLVSSETTLVDIYLYLHAVIGEHAAEQATARSKFSRRQGVGAGPSKRGAATATATATGG